MHILVVSIHVKPGKADEFVALAGDNIRETLKESGVVRFDLLQQKDDPDRFVLYEVYRDPGDHAADKLTPHYRAWNLAAEPLMAEPRTRTVYSAVFADRNGAGSRRRMRFEFSTATRIIFGHGTISELTAAAVPLGKRALLVVGRSAERTESTVRGLQTGGIPLCAFTSPASRPSSLFGKAWRRRARQRSTWLLPSGRAVSSTLARRLPL